MKNRFIIWIIFSALLALAVSAVAFRLPSIGNGNRQDKFIIVDGTTDATNYEYDEDNRLTQVTLRDTEQPKVYTFGYDYRTRRITRETSTEQTIHIFDGGLSVQEYDTSNSSTLSVNNLTTESIRGEGMGGGVGGMVYSVRNGAT